MRAVAFSSFVAAKHLARRGIELEGRAVRRTALPCRMVPRAASCSSGGCWKAMIRAGAVSIWGVLYPVALVLAGCDDAPGEWAAIVYPDLTDRTRFDVQGRSSER